MEKQIQNIAQDSCVVIWVHNFTEPITHEMKHFAIQNINNSLFLIILFFHITYYWMLRQIITGMLARE